MLILWIYRKIKARFGKGPNAQAEPETAQTPESKHASRQALRRDLKLMAALSIPVFLETLDYTVVATAQPHIASAFNRLDLQSYIGTVYLLTSAVFLPVFASLADVYGRHWAMQISLVFFLFGSALSTGARNMPMMLAGRGVAGVGAAGLLTVVRVILADSASLNVNNWQASILIIMYSIGFSVGPVIGGALTNISFRWVFGINLPCCAVSMVLVFLLLRGTAKGPQVPVRFDASGTCENPTPIDRLLRIDWISAFLFVTGGVLLLLALNWGSDQAWKTARVIVCSIVGGLLLIACFAWEYLLERKQKSTVAPSRLFLANVMIPLSVMTSYDVCATQFAAFTSGMVMLVIFYFIAIFMVIVTGLSTVQAGVQLIYFAPGMGAGTFIAIAFIKFLRQPKYPIVLGSCVLPIALGLISKAISDSKQSTVNGFMVMAGIGVGMTFGPLAIHARFSQPSERVAIVVALNLFFRSLGGTVGLAQCSTILNSKVNSYFAGLPASTLADVPLSSLSSGSLGSLQSISQLPPDIQTLVRNAFRSGVRWSFISLIPWCSLSLIGCLFLTNIHDTDRRGVESELKETAMEKQTPAETDKHGAAEHV